MQTALSLTAMKDGVSRAKYNEVVAQQDSATPSKSWVLGSYIVHVVSAYVELVKALNSCSEAVAQLDRATTF